jgi:phosphomannomutase
MAKALDTLFLFDVDGTLSESRSTAPPRIMKMLTLLREKVRIAFVGGSDLEKQKEQIGNSCTQIFDFCFPENGVSFYKDGKLEKQERIIDFMKEDLYKEFVNFCLRYLSELDIPVKRGTFIEYRNSMINISPIGRNCSREERNDFFMLDKEKKYREKMVEELRRRFDEHKMAFSIGGQISIDCFPKGWDKTYCLRHVFSEGVAKVYFFGDMTQEGGNDYEIFTDPRIEKGITVTGPESTIRKVNEVLKEIGMEELKL